MRAADVFLDSNVLLYIISGDSAKRDRAKDLLAAGGVVSVQVLNEFANVASKKYRVGWGPIREVLGTIKALCRVDPLSIEGHERGIAVAETYRLNVYDGLIIAAALLGGCITLYSEHMQDGQKIGAMTIRNPFAGI